MAGTPPDRPMILGNCISCNGLMRVPVTTDVTHVARCPHCGVRFPVQQLIASAIPAAEIMDGEVAQEILPAVDRVKAKEEAAAEKSRTKFEVAKQLHDGAKHRRRRRRRSRSSDDRKSSSGQGSSRRESPPQERTRSRTSDSASTSSRSNGSIRSASVPIAATQSLASAESTGVEVIDGTGLPPNDPSSSRQSANRPTAHRSSNSSAQDKINRRRYPPSQSEDGEMEGSFLEWAKIVLGGLIAFPLAYLGLMWIAGLDPFGLAGPLQSVTPLVVPPSLIIEESASPSTPAADEFEDEGLIEDQLPMPSIDPDEVRG